MKRNNLLLFLVCSLTLIFSKTALCYQETKGGDLESLRFVKMGRLLLKEMKEEKSCRLGTRISVEKFERLINSTEIESGFGEKSYAHRFVFDRIDWFFASPVGTAKKVFEVYSGGSSASVEEISQCMKSPEWKKIVSAEQYHDAGDNQTIQEVHRISSELLPLLKSNQSQLGLSRSFLTRLSEKEGAVLFSLSSSLIPFRNETLKDGTNQNAENSRLEIKINKAMWLSLSHGQKLELVFHEFLGLLKVEDRHYQYSSRLFPLLNAELYSS